MGLEPGRRLGKRRRRSPPLLAVEVAGDDEPEEALRAKASWYLSVGVPTVWLVLPVERAVLVVTTAGCTRHGLGATLPPPTALAELAPKVDELFVQISAG